MKISIILCLAFLSTGCVMGSYPERRCAGVGILVETINIEHNQVGEVETVKTHIECKRLL